MDFLCPNHRRHFAELSLEERKDLWLFWMEYAYSSSEQGQWRDVISLAGSAFDLACLQGTRDQTCMHIELTLAAILVSRVLADRGDHASANRVIVRAMAGLQDDEQAASLEGCCGLAECMAVLKDRSRQAGFFSDYLNWPSLPFARVPYPVSRVLH